MANGVARALVKRGLQRGDEVPRRGHRGEKTELVVGRHILPGFFETRLRLFSARKVSQME